MLTKISLENVPKTPGIYKFLDIAGKVLYVGKAKNLSERLPYYLNSSLIYGKTLKLVTEAEKVEWVKTESEIEALILESTLIKLFKPKYNVSLKDDKGYAYILVSKKGKQSEERFPKVQTVRSKISGKGMYFGPYPNVSVSQILRSLRRVFNFRDCSPYKFNVHRKLGRGCLYESINLCKAPCILHRVNEESYTKVIKELEMFLNGRGSKYLDNLNKEMVDNSNKLNFEKANEIKQRIEKINLLRKISLPAQSYIQNPNLYEDLRHAELKDLEDLLKPYFPGINIAKEGSRIECYDISNLSNSNPVGALITFVDGSPTTRDYRKFKIKEIKGVNDFKMLAEIIGRRFKNRELHFPDLVLVDGGKGQVSSVLPTIQKLNIPVIGLAKRFERLVINGEYLKIPKERSAINLLRRIRDETHRFVVTYQRKKRLSQIKL